MSEVNFDAIREGAKMAVEQGVREGIAAAMEEFGAKLKLPESGFFAAQATKNRRARKAAQASPVTPKRATATSRRKGEKRAPEDMQALTDRLRDHVKANEGQGMEQIAKDLGCTTKELALPMRKLIANGHIAAKGQKRATRYFAT